MGCIDSKSPLFATGGMPGAMRVTLDGCNVGKKAIGFHWKLSELRGNRNDLNHGMQ